MLALPLSELRVLGAKFLELLGGPGKKFGRGLTMPDVIVGWLLTISSFAMRESTATSKNNGATGGKAAVCGFDGAGRFSIYGC